LRTLSGGIALTDDADLGEDAQNAAATCHPTDDQRATSSLDACAHAEVITTLAAEETRLPRKAAEPQIRRRAGVVPRGGGLGP
jgi:hypothetical protein